MAIEGIRVINQNGQDYLQIDTLKNLGDTHQLYQQNPGKANARKLLNAMSSFLRWYIGYAKDRLRNRVYKMENVIPYVVSKNVSNQGIRYYLYLAQLYAENLLNHIDIKKVKNYKELIYTISSDYEELAVAMESIRLQNIHLRGYWWSSSRIRPRTITWCASQVLYMEQLNDLSEVNFRELRPYSLFMARQCIELIGKYTIGYSDIVDQHSKSIHRFSQVAWDFLVSYNKANPGKILVENVSINMIHKINSFTNRFTHTSIFPPIYIMDYINEILFNFMKPISDAQARQHNIHQINLNFGSTIIKDYDLMKQEFEQYIRLRANNANVNWLPKEQVWAYCI